ncbi:MAG: TetR/AcrR family transcriptional regulator [Catenulispora sp.]|nr:TetR/AcrR family transcriptional regulator [Catenulispora sp.]
MPLGLREVKKRQTRQAITEHATRLFVAHGFEATTIAEVAVAARVAKKTVTNYFPRKEDLVLDFQEEFAGSLAETVRSRPAGTPVLHALRARHRTDVRVQAATAGFLGLDITRVIADSPTLTARLRELHEQREAALAEVLTEQIDPAKGVEQHEKAAQADRAGLHGSGSSLATRAVAAHFATAHRILFHRVQELTLAGERPETVGQVVTEEGRQVFDLLAPSFGDYGS